MRGGPQREGSPPALTVGQLFPADDLIANWVFSLSAAAEDLALAERPFVDVLDAPVGPFTPIYAGFQYRQLIARIYEAERPIRAIEALAEVQRFLDGIPAATEPLSALRLFYSPWSDSEPSPVRQLFGSTRHLTVHHSWPGSEELRDALTAARDLQARILVDEAEEHLSYEWVELVALRTMIGDMESPDTLTDQRAKLAVAQELIKNFSSLLNAALSAHCRRLGIDPSRLLDGGTQRSG